MTETQTQTQTQLILIYDAPGSGNAYLVDAHGEFFDRKPGDVRIELGTFSTLPAAVGEARRLGHKVDGWTAHDSQLLWIMPVNQICTPFDDVPPKV